MVRIVNFKSCSKMECNIIDVFWYILFRCTIHIEIGRYAACMDLRFVFATLCSRRATSLHAHRRTTWPVPCFCVPYHIMFLYCRTPRVYFLHVYGVCHGAGGHNRGANVERRPSAGTQFRTMAVFLEFLSISKLRRFLALAY